MAQNNQHLNNCACLEQETREIYELFINSLRIMEEKLKKKTSSKTRTSANYGYTYCEICKAIIKGAGKIGSIKNRNDPRFWSLEVKEKVLCGECLRRHDSFKEGKI